jgi:protein TonB
VRVFAAAGKPAARRPAQGELPPPGPGTARPGTPWAAVTAARAALSSFAAAAWHRWVEAQARQRYLGVQAWQHRAAGQAWHRYLNGHARFGSAITYAVVASLLIHGVLLALRFTVLDPRKLADRGPPLEIVLVNAKSMLKPTKADLLAQANLDGGGNTDADRRARTPLPVPPRNNASADLALTAKKAEDLERRAQELMTQLKAVPATPVLPEPAAAPDKARPLALAEATQQTLEVMRLEAQIARDMSAYQKLPKRRQVGVRAEEYRFARYVEDWRQKVERVGNLNYPEAARQLKLYGNLILTVSIRADGSVERVVIERSSGHRLLDAAAARIVEMAAPYSPFPAEIRRDTDILDITRTWTFARGDELRSD